MKTYLVKKDINKPNSEDNWIIMTGYEFARFMETEDGQRRKKNFARLEPCSEHDDIIILECGEEKAKAWENERLRSLYHVCAKAKHPLLSYDGIMPGKHVYCGEDVIADITVDVEACVIRKDELTKLQEALHALTAIEMKLVQLMFLTEEPLTEKEYADICGICQSSAHERKIRVLMKLQNILKNLNF